MSATSKQQRLTELNFQIEELESQAGKLNTERATIAKEASRAARRLRYLQFARSFRRPAAALELWPVAALVIGPVVVGIVLFVLTHLVFGSLGLALLALLLGLVGGLILVSGLLYRPPDAVLESTIADAEAQTRLANARLQEKIERLAETNRKLKQLIDERRDQIASGKLQRAALLQRNWKGMRDAEWEDFVVEAFRTHGASVERSGRTSEEDADLVVDLEMRRAAVLTRGEGQPIDSATIRRALSAKDRHKCDTCAVIVNRRFTGAAQDFAQRNGCQAIGIGEFPDFVLGKIEL